MNPYFFKRIKRTYDALQDEQSRQIFEKRLLYSLSGDKEHIYSLIDAEMIRYVDVDVMYSLIGWLEKYKEFRSVVIFGAGFAGYEISEVLKHRNIAVSGFVDNNNNLWGQERYGISIINPKDLKEKEGVVVIIGTNSGVDEIEKQLASIGISSESIFAPKSQWWLGKYKQYFDPDICIPGNDEVFVDGGAFDGEDTIRFIRWNKGTSHIAYVFEPEHNHFLNTSKRLSSYHEIEVFEKGLWESAGVQSFEATLNADSSVSDNGECKIETISIDEMGFQQVPTFIKMDIEGSEAKALEGARETIIKYKPRLAICVYHKPEDIVEIPDLILDMVPDYKLYLRHYSYVDTETVLYAV